MRKRKNVKSKQNDEKDAHVKQNGKKKTTPKLKQSKAEYTVHPLFEEIKPTEVSRAEDKETFPASEYKEFEKRHEKLSADTTFYYDDESHETEKTLIEEENLNVNREDTNLPLNGVIESPNGDKNLELAHSIEEDEIVQPHEKKSLNVDAGSLGDSIEVASHGVKDTDDNTKEHAHSEQEQIEQYLHEDHALSESNIAEAPSTINSLDDSSDENVFQEYSGKEIGGTVNKTDNFYSAENEHITDTEIKEVNKKLESEDMFGYLKEINDNEESIEVSPSGNKNKDDIYENEQQDVEEDVKSESKITTNPASEGMGFAKEQATEILDDVGRRREEMVDTSNEEFNFANEAAYEHLEDVESELGEAIFTAIKEDVTQNNLNDQVKHIEAELKETIYTTTEKFSASEKVFAKQVGNAEIDLVETLDTAIEEADVLGEGADEQLEDLDIELDQTIDIAHEEFGVSKKVLDKEVEDSKSELVKTSDTVSEKARVVSEKVLDDQLKALGSDLEMNVDTNNGEMNAPKEDFNERLEYAERELEETIEIPNDMAGVLSDQLKTVKIKFVDIIDTVIEEVNSPAEVLGEHLEDVEKDSGETLYTGDKEADDVHVEVLYKQLEHVERELDNTIDIVKDDTVPENVVDIQDIERKMQMNKVGDEIFLEEITENEDDYADADLEDLDQTFQEEEQSIDSAAIKDSEKSTSRYHVEEIRVKFQPQQEDEEIPSGYTEISPGVSKMIIAHGAGNLPPKGAEVSIHCDAYIDGNIPEKFWSTKDPGQKVFTFLVGKRQVIRGWDEGVASMRLNEHSKIKIAANKAYGKYGFDAWNIPPHAKLLFDITVIQIKRSNKE